MDDEKLTKLIGIESATSLEQLYASLVALSTDERFTVTDRARASYLLCSRATWFSKDEATKGLYAQMLLMCARMQDRDGTPGMCVFFMKEAMQILEELGQTGEQYAEAAHCVGSSYLDWNEWEDAQPFLAKAVEAGERVFAPDDERLAACYNSTARLHFFLGNGGTALLYINKCLEIRKKRERESPLELAEGYIMMGRIYALKDELRKCVDCFVNALELQERFFGLAHNEVNHIRDLLYYVKRDVDACEPETLEHLLECFKEDEEVCNSLQQYPDQFNVVKGEWCPECGGRMVRLYYRSSDDSWEHFAGREGFLTICKKCKQWHRTQWHIMN